MLDDISSDADGASDVTYDYEEPEDLYKQAADMLDKGKYGHVADLSPAAARANDLRNEVLRAAQEALPSKRGELKTCVLSVKASGDESDRIGDSISFGQILMGPFRDKSYIRQKDSSGKWSSGTLINVSGTPHHQRICWKLFHHLLEHPVTKEELTSLGDEWKQKMDNGEPLSEDDEDVAGKIVALMDD